MSEENVKALTAVYEQWSRGNYQPRFEVYANDFEWGWSEEFPDLHGVKRDPEERSPGLREWLAPWEDWRCEAEDYVVHGSFVVVLTRYRGRGKGSGATVDTEGAHVWKMLEGRAMRLEVFADRARALESVGLGK